MLSRVIIDRCGVTGGGGDVEGGTRVGGREAKEVAGKGGRSQVENEGGKAEGGGEAEDGGGEAEKGYRRSGRGRWRSGGESGRSGRGRGADMTPPGPERIHPVISLDKHAREK